MEVRLYSFSKKRNSTKLPTDSGTLFNGQLKQSFTVTGLEVTFNLGVMQSAPVYNYCYIPSFRRYYFVTDWYYSGGLWTALLACDVLASFRNDIGNSFQYVLRSYSNYDPNIIDTEYPTSPSGIIRLHASIQPSTFWGASVSATEGTIVIGAVGRSAGAVGAVTYYAMSFTTFTALMNTMLTDVSWVGTTEVSQDLLKALVNPTQYIVSCRWYPILFSGFSQGASVSVLGLGWWNFNLSGTAQLLNTVTSAWITRQNELTIPKHPQASGRNAYLDCAPYSSYMLKFLPFGVFEIDTTELYDKTYLGLQVDVNLMTGDAVLRVSSKGATGVYDFENAFLVTEGQIGVTLPIGQVSFDTNKIISAINTGRQMLGGLV